MILKSDDLIRPVGVDRCVHPADRCVRPILILQINQERVANRFL